MSDPQPHQITLAIDAVGAKHSGAATVLLAIVSSALAQPEFERVIVFVSPQKCRRFVLPVSPKLQIEERPYEEWSLFARLIWFEFALARAVERHKADVLLTLSAGGRPPLGTSAIAFLHQPVPFLEPSETNMSSFRRLRYLVLKVTMARSARASRLVITQTNAFQRLVQQALKLPSKSVRTISFCAPQLPPPPIELPPRLRALAAVPKGQRVLYVGDNSPHKNVDVLIRGIRHLRNLGHPVTLFLTFDEASRSVKDPAIVFLGFLSRLELAAAYSAADLLVVPSLIESLGLPLLEAMSFGLPILAADRPYAHEVTNGFAEFFDPHDHTSFALHCQHALESSNLQRSRAESARNHAARLEGTKPYQELIRTILETYATTHSTSPSAYSRQVAQP